MKKLLITAAFAAFTPLAAFAHDGVHADDAYAFATSAAAKTAAAYVEIENHGPATRLTGAKSDVAAKTEIHISEMKDGVMSMSPAGEVELPVDGELELEPGGMHIMLMGLKAPLSTGQSFPVTLTFATGEEVEVEVMVRERGDEDARDHDHGHEHGHKHD